MAHEDSTLESLKQEVEDTGIDLGEILKVLKDFRNETEVSANDLQDFFVFIEFYTGYYGKPLEAILPKDDEYSSDEVNDQRIRAESKKVKSLYEIIHNRAEDALNKELEKCKHDSEAAGWRIPRLAILKVLRDYARPKDSAIQKKRLWIVFRYRLMGIYAFCW